LNVAPLNQPFEQPRYARVVETRQFIAVKFLDASNGELPDTDHQLALTLTLATI